MDSFYLMSHSYEEWITRCQGLGFETRPVAIDRCFKSIKRHGMIVDLYTYPKQRVSHNAINVADKTDHKTRDGHGDGHDKTINESYGCFAYSDQAFGLDSRENLYGICFEMKKITNERTFANAHAQITITFGDDPATNNFGLTYEVDAASFFGIVTKTRILSINVITKNLVVVLNDFSLAEEQHIVTSADTTAEVTVLSPNQQPKDAKEQPKDVKEQPKDAKEYQKDVKEQPKDVKKQPKDVKEQPKDVKEQPKDVKDVKTAVSIVVLPVQSFPSKTLHTDVSVVKPVAQPHPDGAPDNIGDADNNNFSSDGNFHAPNGFSSSQPNNNNNSISIPVKLFDHANKTIHNSSSKHDRLEC